MNHELNYELVRQMITSSLETIDVYKLSIKSMQDLLNDEERKLLQLRSYMEKTESDAN